MVDKIEKVIEKWGKRKEVSNRAIIIASILIIMVSLSKEFFL